MVAYGEGNGGGNGGIDDDVFFKYLFILNITL